MPWVRRLVQTVCLWPEMQSAISHQPQRQQQGGSITSVLRCTALHLRCAVALCATGGAAAVVRQNCQCVVLALVAPKAA